MALLTEFWTEGLAEAGHDAQAYLEQLLRAGFKVAVLERSGALMDQLNCRGYASKRVGELSGGTKQKLNLIIALLHRPALLILDEPYQGFDYESYLAFWDLADGFKRDGRSAVVVSHMLVDQERLDRVYSIVEGQITGDDTDPRG